MIREKQLYICSKCATVVRSKLVPEKCRKCKGDTFIREKSVMNKGEVNVRSK